MKSTPVILVLGLAFGLMVGSDALAQAKKPAKPAAPKPAVTEAKPIPKPASVGSDDVVMATQEITISVPTELPTVIVTIPRQKPEITSVILKKDAEDLITAGNREVRPKLVDLQVNQVEQPEKMLAQPRAQ